MRKVFKLRNVHRWVPYPSFVLEKIDADPPYSQEELERTRQLVQEKADMLASLTGNIKAQSAEFQQIRARKALAAQSRGSELFSSINNYTKVEAPAQVKVIDVRTPVEIKPVKEIIKINRIDPLMHDWRVPKALSP